MTVRYAKDQPAGFTNRIEKVAIAGAGGQVGSHLAREILKNGEHILTAIQRAESTNKLPDGINVIRVDYSGDDDTALVEALHGQQVLLITMAVTAQTVAIPKLVRAAAKAGVPYVLPNWIGHDAANDKLCEESMLKAARDKIANQMESLGVSSRLLLVCNFWYEFSLGGGPDRFGFDFQKRSFTWFDDGNVPFCVSTWPQCGRAIAALLSLKEFPEDEADKEPTLSQFRNTPVYISSFRLTQRDMFESVKRVTGTTDADWTIGCGSSEQRWKEGSEAVKQGNFAMYPKMLYSRMFFPSADGDYQSRVVNELLGLPIEDLDEATALAVKIGENGELGHSH